MSETVWSVTLALPDRSPRLLGTVSAASGSASGSGAGALAGALASARWPLYPPESVWLASDAAPDGPRCLADLHGCPDGPPGPETASTGLLAPPATVSEAPLVGIMAQIRARGLTPGQRKVRDRKAQLARSERLRAHYQAKVASG